MSFKLHAHILFIQKREVFAAKKDKKIPIHHFVIPLATTNLLRQLRWKKKWKIIQENCGNEDPSFLFCSVHLVEGIGAGEWTRIRHTSQTVGRIISGYVMISENDDADKITIIRMFIISRWHSNFKLSVCLGRYSYANEQSGSSILQTIEKAAAIMAD